MGELLGNQYYWRRKICLCLFLQDLWQKMRNWFCSTQLVNKKDWLRLNQLLLFWHNFLSNVPQMQRYLGPTMQQGCHRQLSETKNSGLFCYLLLPTLSPGVTCKSRYSLCSLSWVLDSYCLIWGGGRHLHSSLSSVHLTVLFTSRDTSLPSC